MTRQQALSLPYTHATYRDGVTEVELPNGARVRFDERWPRLPVTVPKVPAFMSTAKRERTIARDARNEPREGQGVSHVE